MNIWKHKHLLRNIVLLFIGGIVLGLISGMLIKDRHDSSTRKPLIAKDTLVVAFTFKTTHPNRLGYAAGLEFYLLKKFAESERCRIVFLTTGKDTLNFLTALREGKVDILVADSADCDFLLEDKRCKFSERLGDCRWVVRKNNRFILSELDDWLEEFSVSEEYRRLKDSFALLKMIPLENAIETPYDNLLKSNARILGWDWRLLASLVFQESKFLMFTVSPRGASGLMQIRPAVAEMYGVDDIFDPEDNIRAGVLFLSRLQGMFPIEHYDSVNALKMTLAAYNCGEGRIKDCINFARYKGKQEKKWEEIVSVIPEMNEIPDSSLNEVVKLGSFNGTETIKFVEQILSRYEKYILAEK